MRYLLFFLLISFVSCARKTVTPDANAVIRPVLEGGIIQYNSVAPELGAVADTFWLPIHVNEFVDTVFYATFYDSHTFEDSNFCYRITTAWDIAETSTTTFKRPIATYFSFCEGKEFFCPEFQDTTDVSDRFCIRVNDTVYLRGVHEWLAFPVHR